MWHSKDSWRVRCLFLHSLAVFLTLPSPAMAQGMQSRDFILTTVPSGGVTRLDPGWTATSRLACGTRCMARYDNCYSFMFNRNTGLCTPGSFYSTAETVPSTAEGDLYLIQLCEGSPTFSLYSYATTLACLTSLQPELFYPQAVIACQDMGAYLMSVKTFEKLMIYRNMVEASGYIENVWVGCDDIVQEGVYVWQEDGTSFTSATKPNLFAPNEPANFNNEDCILLDTRENWQLNDLQCSTWPARFACEKQIVYA